MRDFNYNYILLKNKKYAFYIVQYLYLKTI